jgi:hypothetical protein
VGAVSIRVAVVARHPPANVGPIVAPIKPSLAMDTERAIPRGAVPLSFAVVARNRVVR